MLNIHNIVLTLLHANIHQISISFWITYTLILNKIVLTIQIINNKHKLLTSL